MSRMSRLLLWGFLMSGLLLWGRPAAGGVNLHFTPADTVIVVGGTGRISVMVDDTVSIRTFEVTVAYDTTIVRSLGGQGGSLFTDSGLFIFEGFQETEPGTWYGYALIMGAGLDVTGPGEVFVWDFEGRSEGVTGVAVSPILPDTIGVYLADVDANWYDDLVLAPTSIRVGSGISSAGPPTGTGTHEIRIWPNPFNPETMIEWTAPVGNLLRLEVYDPRGRRIRVLTGERCGDGTIRTRWDGRDRLGAAVSSGVYLFRGETSVGWTVTRGVLLK